MKKLLLVSLTSLQLFAAEVVFNALPAGTNVVQAGAIVLDKIVLYSSAVTPTTVYLLDGLGTPTATAMTNYVAYPTNRITSYITTLGTTNLMTNTVLYYAPIVTPAGTLTIRPLASVVVPPNNQTVTYDLDTGSYTLTKGLVLSNAAAGVSGVATYRTQ